MVAYRLPVILGLLLAAAPVHAAPVDDLLAAAATALQAGRYGEVEEYSRRAEKVADESDIVIPAGTQGRIWFLCGLAEWLDEEQEAAMDTWRIALSVNPKAEWDPSFPNDKAESVFESLRREVASRPLIDLGIPEETGSARLYVSGHLAAAGDQAVEGRYLVQALCGDGVVYSRWWKYGKPPRYDTWCPDGFNASPAPATEGTEAVAVLFDDFGNPITETPPSLPVEVAPVPTIPPPATQPDTPPATQPDTPPATEPLVPPAEKPAREGRDRSVGGRILFWSGMGVLGVGTGINFLVVNPAFDKVVQARENPSDYTSDQARSISRSFDQARYLTLGVLGAGIVLGTTGVFVETPPIIVSPWGVLVQGRF